MTHFYFVFLSALLILNFSAGFSAYAITAEQKAALLERIQETELARAMMQALSNPGAFDEESEGYGGAGGREIFKVASSKAVDLLTALIQREKTAERSFDFGRLLTQAGQIRFKIAEKAGDEDAPFFGQLRDLRSTRLRVAKGFVGGADFTDNLVSIVNQNQTGSSYKEYPEWYLSIKLEMLSFMADVANSPKLANDWVHSGRSRFRLSIIDPSERHPKRKKTQKQEGQQRERMKADIETASPEELYLSQEATLVPEEFIDTYYSDVHARTLLNRTRLGAIKLEFQVKFEERFGVHP